MQIKSFSFIAIVAIAIALLSITALATAPLSDEYKGVTETAHTLTQDLTTSRTDYFCWGTQCM
ncbi:hypothetical protein [Pseudoalteromonas sp. SG44-8]|uniref:hypothetical protein n=1 Tax=Pseudoalteromonas sp. SG44-8 TaxID=2760958 RepID=UPI0016015301|nr:hypothetical protein [Pseudoalteromonas sp. SG44-8]MBB1399616.1 hypothetical protein [Pseudoalteromonas sp. SG44-8]